MCRSVVYNQTLFREITGLVRAADFREFIAACEKIKAYARAHHEMLVPIAGAGKYNAGFLFNRFESAITATLLPVLDVNHDNDVSTEENAIALVGGAVNFHDPRIQAMFRGPILYRAISAGVLPGGSDGCRVSLHPAKGTDDCQRHVGCRQLRETGRL